MGTKLPPQDFRWLVGWSLILAEGQRAHKHERVSRQEGEPRSDWVAALD